MNDSPLTQVAPPSSAKIVALYASLTNADPAVPLPPSFWPDLFALRPDPVRFAEMLSEMTARDMLATQIRWRRFVAEAVRRVERSSASPIDTIEPGDRNGVGAVTALAADNADIEAGLVTLTVFVRLAGSKSFQAPSADLIAIMAGMQDVDSIMSRLVRALDHGIRSTGSVQAKAVDAALALATTAAGTSLMTYLLHHNLFPAVMQAIESAPSATATIAIVLLAVLAGHAKLDTANPYQVRLAHYVGLPVMNRLAVLIGQSCVHTRDQYAAVRPDVAEGWQLSSLVSGLGLWNRRPETDDTPFDGLPAPEIAVLPTLYEFCRANRMFRSVFVRAKSEPTDGGDGDVDTPLGSLLSVTSYLAVHARTRRTVAYTLASLATIQILLEDPEQAKLLAAAETKTTSRLCRQRAPVIVRPWPAKTSRVPAAVLVDVLAETFGQRSRGSAGPAAAAAVVNRSLAVVLRLLGFLGRTKTQLPTGESRWAGLWEGIFRASSQIIRHGTEDANRVLAANVVGVLSLVLVGPGVADAVADGMEELVYRLLAESETIEKLKSVWQGKSTVGSSSATEPSSNSTAPTSGSRPNPDPTPPSSASSSTAFSNPPDLFFPVKETVSHFAVLSKLTTFFRNMVEGAGSETEVRNAIKTGMAGGFQSTATDALVTVKKAAVGEPWAWRVYREADDVRTVKTVANVAVEDGRRVKSESR